MAALAKLERSAVATKALISANPNFRIDRNLRLSHTDNARLSNKHQRLSSPADEKRGFSRHLDVARSLPRIRRRICDDPGFPLSSAVGGTALDPGRAGHRRAGPGRAGDGQDSEHRPHEVRGAPQPHDRGYA